MRYQDLNSRSHGLAVFILTHRKGNKTILSLFTYSVCDEKVKMILPRVYFVSRNLFSVVIHSSPLMVPVVENVFTFSELKPTYLFNLYLLT